MGLFLQPKLLQPGFTGKTSLDSFEFIKSSSENHHFVVLIKAIEMHIWNT